MKENILKRTEKLREAMAAQGADAFVVFSDEDSNWESLFYLSGFRGTAGAAVGPARGRGEPDWGGLAGIQRPGRRLRGHAGRRQLYVFSILTARRLPAAAGGGVCGFETLFKNTAGVFAADRFAVRAVCRGTLQHAGACNP